MRKTFATPGPVALVVEVPAGEIALETVPCAETTDELEPLGSDEASREAAETARVDMRERGAGGQEVRVVIESRGGLRWGFGRSPEVLARITVPHGTSVEAETASADIRARGRYAEASVRVASADVEFDEIERDASVNGASGDVTLRRVGGDIRVNTASGDVEVDEAGGAVRANTASGDVLVRRARGPVEVQSASGDVVVGDVAAGARVSTASGDQRVDAVSEGDVMLESASGDVRVGVRRGSRLWVDASSRSGDVTSDFDVGDASPTADGPLVELRARSGSGDIHVARV